MLRSRLVDPLLLILVFPEGAGDLQEVGRVPWEEEWLAVVDKEVLGNGEKDNLDVRRKI